MLFELASFMVKPIQDGGVTTCKFVSEFPLFLPTFL